MIITLLDATFHKLGDDLRTHVLGNWKSVHKTCFRIERSLWNLIRPEEEEEEEEEDSIRACLHDNHATRNEENVKNIAAFRQVSMTDARKSKKHQNFLP
jgi:hypothetical protein